MNGKRIDILTGNPPYIPYKDWFKLSDSVKLYEPSIALIGDLIFYDNLIKFWSNLTNSFIYEIGYIHQFNYIKDNLSKYNNDNWIIKLCKDSNNKPRLVYGYRKNIPFNEILFNKFLYYYK